MDDDHLSIEEAENKIQELLSEHEFDKSKDDLDEP